MIKVFHIREARLLDPSGAGMTFGRKAKGSKLRTHLPKSQILSFEPYKVGREKWLKVSVTKWIWDKANLDRQFKDMITHGELILEGQTHFRLNWDEVRRRSRYSEHCFFCLSRLMDHNRTGDHLVSRHILRQNNLTALPHNKVPCCKGCNGLKGPLHPVDFRAKVSLKLHETGLVYYATIKACLDDIIIN